MSKSASDQTEILQGAVPAPTESSARSILKGGIKKALQRTLRAMGYDLLPYPVPPWAVLRDHLMELFGKLQINCVLDVGAHYGEYGRFLRNSGYAGRIISFEPVPANFRLLQETTRSDKLWSSQCLALGNENITSSINVTQASKFSSFLQPNAFCTESFGRKGTIEHKEGVNVRRLDDVMDQYGSELDGLRLFLKLDTQGYDLKVLDGLQRHMWRVCALQSELSIQPIYDGMIGYLEFLNILRQRAFEPSGFFPVSNTNDGALIEADCVLVSRERQIQSA